MKIYEQADKSSSAPMGAIYSWILDGVRRKDALWSNLSAAGWKWTKGRPGCFVTNDPELVARTANSLLVDVVSNGTHEVLGVPVCLCDPRNPKGA